MPVANTVTLPRVMSPSNSHSNNECKIRTFHIRPFFDTVTNIYEEVATKPDSNTNSAEPRKNPRPVTKQPSFVVTHTPHPKRSHLFRSSKYEPLCDIEVAPQTYPANTVSSCCHIYPSDPKHGSIGLYTQSAEDNKVYEWPEEPMRHEWSNSVVAEAVSNLSSARKAIVTREMAWSELWHEGTRVLELHDSTARREDDKIVARAAFAKGLCNRTGTVDVYDRFENDVHGDIFVADVLASLMGEIETLKADFSECDDGLSIQRTKSVLSKSSRSSQGEHGHSLFKWGKDFRGRHRSPSGALASAITGTALAGTGLKVP